MTKNIFGDLMAITMIRAVIIYIFVTLAIRIMGKRQVGELNPQELVITILISAVATVPLEDNGMPLANSLVPIAIFIALELLNSALSMKSLWFRNLVQGKPIFIIRNGKIQQDQLQKLRYTMDDLIDSARQSGAFDIAEIENAVVETNGSLSIQLKNEVSPITPKQMGIKCEKADVPITIIIDGEVVEKYYGNAEYNEDEIRLLAISNGEQVENIMAMSVDNSGKVYIIKKENK